MPFVYVFLSGMNRLIEPVVHVTGSCSNPTAKPAKFPPCLVHYTAGTVSFALFVSLLYIIASHKIRSFGPAWHTISQLGILDIRSSPLFHSLSFNILVQIFISMTSGSVETFSAGTGK